VELYYLEQRLLTILQDGNHIAKRSLQQKRCYAFLDNSAKV